MKVKICDFGLSVSKIKIFILLFSYFFAKVNICAADSCLKVETENQIVAGTYPYMAPEVRRRDPCANEKIDVYSFGIMFWSMLTTKAPYHDYLTEKGYSMDLPNFLDVEKGRPSLEELKEFPITSNYLKQCWDENPAKRPNFKKVKTQNILYE